MSTKGLARTPGLPFVWGARTYIMGIVNITPDSFSGDGLAEDVAQAVRQARAMVDAGADIIDVGGESTRPGAAPVTEQDELARVVKAIRAIAASISVPISIDTSKAGVAAAALQAGAHIVNDVWALEADPAMASVVAKAGVPLILMHNQRGTEYGDLIQDIMVKLKARVEVALQAGIPRDHLILDPGIGFGKTGEQNLVVIDRLHELCELELPLLLGPSRKRFIGHILDDAPPHERIEGTAAACAVGIARGADIIRVHDVGPMAKVARVADAIVRRTDS